MNTPGGLFIRGAVLSSAGMLFSMACTLVAAVVFTRVIPAESVGVFSLLILLTDLFILGHNGGLMTSLPKLIAATADESRPRLIRSCLIGQFWTSVVVGLPVWALWTLLGDPGRVSDNASWTGLFPFLWVLPFFFLVANWRENAMAALAGLNRYGYRALGLGFAALANVGLVLALTWWFRWGLAGLLAATLGSYVAAAFWFSGGIPWRGGSPRLSWREYRRALVFSWPLWVNNLLTFGFLRADTLFVAALLGPGNAAYFEYVAKKLPSYAARLMGAAQTPFLPGISALISQGDTAGASRLLNRTSEVFLFLGYATVFPTLLAQEWIVGWLFPPEYLRGVPALGLILTSLCLAIQAGTMGQALIASGRPGWVTAANTMTGAVSLAANCLLIPWLGMVGAGWAAIGAMAFSNLLQTFLARRAGLAVDAIRYVRCHALMVLAVAAVWLAGGYPGRFLGLFVFTAGGLALGVLNQDDFRMAVAALRHRALPAGGPQNEEGK